MISDTVKRKDESSRWDMAYLNLSLWRDQGGLKEMDLVLFRGRRTVGGGVGVGWLAC
jgi:hypothetical protein